MAAFMDIYPDFDLEEKRISKDIYSLNDNKFNRLYRFDKNTFRFIADLIRNDLERPTHRSSSLSTEIQLAAAVRYYATGCFQTDVGEGLNISQPSVYRAVCNVGSALDKVFDDYIKWPDTQTLTGNKLIFYKVARFPRVIGTIDCTHIRIQRPSTEENQYVNRKFYHSLNVQAVSGPTGLLHNVEVNWPGSNHDAFILRFGSNVWSHMERSPHHGYILGDSAYPLREWLLTPLSNPTTPSELAYNSAHKRTRVIIEHTFGRLKRRFHLLHSENRRRTIKNVVEDVRACCVLHNIAVLNKQEDFTDHFDDDQPPIVFYDGPSSGRLHRQRVINNYFS